MSLLYTGLRGRLLDNSELNKRRGNLCERTPGI